MIALIPTYILLKYGWRAIDVMKRMDLESRTPWYQHTLATVTGLSIIRTFKKENEAIDLFYELEDDNSSAYFLFFNSLRTVFVTIIESMTILSITIVFAFKDPTGTFLRSFIFENDLQMVYFSC